MEETLKPGCAGDRHQRSLASRSASQPACDDHETSETRPQLHGKPALQSDVAVPDVPRDGSPQFLSTVQVGQASRGRARPPLVPRGRHAEHITVSESDLKRYGHDLRMLRRCAISPKPREAQQPQLQLADQPCKTDLFADVRDPWKGLPNPDFYRERTDQDRILSQGWIGSLSPRRMDHDPAHPASPPKRSDTKAMTRCRSESAVQAVSQDGRARPQSASPPSPAPLMLVSPPQSGSWFDKSKINRRLKTSKLEVPPRSLRGAGGDRAGDRSPHSIGSGGLATTEDTSRDRDSGGQAPSRTSRRGSRSGSWNGLSEPRAEFGGAASSVPRSRDSRDGRHRRHSATDARPTESSVRLLDLRAPEELAFDAIRAEHGGAHTRLMRHLADHEIRESGYREHQDPRNNKKGRVLWLALDRGTGEIQPYSKAASLRIEAAASTGRGSVPLAGLGGKLESAIVHFSKSSDGRFFATQETWKGDHHLAAIRLHVPEGYAPELYVDVAFEHEAWHVVEGSLSPVEEDASPELHLGPHRRRVALFAVGCEAVRPPSPALPPVDPDRRLNFINPSTVW